jgi:hypothetical protein
MFSHHSSAPKEHSPPSNNINIATFEALLSEIQNKDLPPPKPLSKVQQLTEKFERGGEMTLEVLEWDGKVTKVQANEWGGRKGYY